MVLDAFEKEKPAMVELAENTYPCAERKDVQVGKTPYVRFDLNDYSVPYKFVKRELTVRATPGIVEVFNGTEEVAHHIRCYDKGKQLEDAEHLKELEQFKEAGLKHRTMDVLRHAAPSVQELMKQAADRGHNLGRLTQRLTELLHLYGPEELEAAIAEALISDSPHADAVRQSLESRRRKRKKGLPVVLNFSTDSSALDLIVVPKSLSVYDQLSKSKED